MTTQDTENQAGGAESTETELKMEQKVAYENKAAAESTIEGGEGNGTPTLSPDSTASATTSDAAASTASTDGGSTPGEVPDGGSAPDGAKHGDTHAA